MAYFPPELCVITDTGMQMLADVAGGGQVHIVDVVSTSRSVAGADDLKELELIPDSWIKDRIDILAKSTIDKATKFELAYSNRNVNAPYNLHQILFRGYSADENGHEIRGSKINPVVFYACQTSPTGYDPIPQRGQAVTVYYVLYLVHTMDVEITVDGSAKSYTLVSPMLNDLIATLDANGDLANPLPDNGVTPGLYNQIIVNQKGLVVWGENKHFLSRDDLVRDVVDLQKVVQLEHGDEFPAIDSVIYDDLGTLTTISTTRYVLPGGDLSKDYNNPFVVGLRMPEVTKSGNYELDYPITRMVTLREVSYWQDYTASSDQWSVVIPFYLTVNKVGDGGRVVDVIHSPSIGYKSINRVGAKLSLEPAREDFDESNAATFDIESVPLNDYTLVIRRSGQDYKIGDTVTIRSGSSSIKVTVTAVNNSGAISAFKYSPTTGAEVLAEVLVSQYSTDGDGTGCAFTLTSDLNLSYEYHVSINQSGLGYKVNDLLMNPEFNDQIVSKITVKDMVQSKRIIPSRKIYPGSLVRFILYHTENRPPLNPDLEYNPPSHPDSKGVVAWVYEPGSGYSSEDKTYVDLSYYDSQNMTLSFDELNVENGHLLVGEHPGTPFSVEAEGKYPIVPFYRSLINDGSAVGSTTIPMGQNANQGETNLTQLGSGALICLTPLMYYRITLDVADQGEGYRIGDRVELMITPHYTVTLLVTEITINGGLLDFLIDKDQWTTTGKEDRTQFYYTVEHNETAQSTLTLTGHGLGATITSVSEEVDPVPVLPRPRTTQTAIDYSFTVGEEAD